MGTDSEDDFINLFEDIDLNSTKLGRNPDTRNELIVKVLSHLEAIDFELSNSESDVLGDAYEYVIGKFASGTGKKAGEPYIFHSPACDDSYSTLDTKSRYIARCDRRY